MKLNKKIVPIGSLVQDPVNEDYDHGEKMEILEWLQKKERSSTVFVSFGSEYFLSQQKIDEIAHRLEHSMVNFIWVVRFTIGKEKQKLEVLPKRYLEKVKERGIVVDGPKQEY
ncbi:hypothetical protein JCGZ_18411 [Jatropha curcas]|uniref:Anthocyanidin 3-O-glucosyltransferase n=1 Tax=Jatropha curcas TaxID=180498 RepID=A0A067K0U0_JATCU|nr:hypothetical protein JCGZ_18411 [Jatropha curcas]